MEGVADLEFGIVEIDVGVAEIGIAMFDPRAELVGEGVSRPPPTVQPHSVFFSLLLSLGLRILPLYAAAMVKLNLKRVYDPPAKSDGARVLVDRLWPRGIAKEKAKIDLWLKDIAPSHELRKKFHGHPEAWDEFVGAYGKELKSDAAQAAVAELEALSRKGPVTLLYAARDDAHNNAVALKAWLAKRK